MQTSVRSNRTPIPSKVTEMKSQPWAQVGQKKEKVVTKIVACVPSAHGKECMLSMCQIETKGDICIDTFHINGMLHNSIVIII